MSDILDGIFAEPDAAPVAAPTPEPQPTPEPVAEHPVAETQLETPETEDEHVPEPKPGERMVPLSALEKTRTDWRSKAAVNEEKWTASEKRANEAEARRLELEAEVARLRAVQAPPQQHSQPAATPQKVPNYIEDPEGYNRWQAEQLDQRVYNTKLDLSESMYKQAFPGVDTQAIAQRFLQEAQRKPELTSQLKASPHPYAFAADYLKRLDAMAEIGDDPAAYRAKIEAEIRASLTVPQITPQLPQQVVVPPRQPPPQFPATLATTRSASAPVQQMQEAPGDILDGVIPKGR